MPDEPEVPDEPDVPLEPEDPLVPDEPEVPDVPEEPSAPLVLVFTLPLLSTVRNVVSLPTGIEVNCAFDAVINPPALILSDTSNFSLGEVVPIPKLPVVLI